MLASILTGSGKRAHNVVVNPNGQLSIMEGWIKFYYVAMRVNTA